MTSHVKQQLLLKQLHEVGDCFAQPTVNQVERLKKVSQLKACIANVEKVCDELHDSQQLLKQGGGDGLLRQRLEEANAAFEREKARAEAAELSARKGGSASPPEVRQLTARIVQLEKELAERTAQLEASAARLQASSTPRKAGSFKGEAVLNQRVASLTREVEERTAELEVVKAHSGDTQKQLWDTRESLQALRQSREAEAERHHHEVEKLRQQIVDLQHSYPGTPSRRTSRTSGTGALAGVLGEEAAAELMAHADMPETDESMSPEVLHYRRQLVAERHEQARMRKERDEARSLLEYRSAELRRNQVRLPSVSCQRTPPYLALKVFFWISPVFLHIRHAFPS